MPSARHMSRRGFAPLVSLVLLLALAAPVHADDSGTVNATVTVSTGPCIIVGASQLDFGSIGFSTAAANSTSLGSVDGTSAETYQLESCSSDAQEFFARGTDAASSSSAAAWSLAQGSPFSLLCDGSANEYWITIAVQNPAGGAFSAVFLRSDVNALVPHSTSATTPVGAGEVRTARNEIWMPCDTSDGVGESFGMSITYTAAVAS